MSGIVLSGITKGYAKGPVVLRSVNLDIREGEFVVIVGPSGCGKSTLLRMIAGLDRPDTGDVVIGGRRANDLAPRDRDIAMIFQNYALYPHMSVRENIAFGLELRGMRRREREARAADVARLLQIEAFLDRKPGALSGGQRQRVAIGRALARDTRTFLMDEPLSNLDHALRVEMRAEIKALHRQLGATIVYVTHDQTEALSMADRIAVMKDGVILQYDRPDVIYDAPASRFVAGFLGSPPMNFFDAGKVPGDPCEGKVAGIRPEAVAVSTAPNPGLSVEGTIGLSELAGATVTLHCDTSLGRIVAVVPRGQVPESVTRVWLSFESKDLHLFDP